MARTRDGDGDGVQKYRHGWIPISPNYKEATRTSPSDWVADTDTLRAIPEEGESSDSRLAHLWRQQGFDGKPELVSPAEFDALPRNHMRVYRGLHGYNATRYAEDFRSGDAYAGLGVHGNGTYTATSRKDAEEFAALEGGQGVTMRIAIRPEARVIARDKVWDEWDRAVARDGVPREVQYAMGGDVGRIATALGYDIMHISADEINARDAVDGEYYLVLNRTAVIVEDPGRGDQLAAPDAPSLDRSAFMDLFAEMTG